MLTHYLLLATYHLLLTTYYYAPRNISAHYLLQVEPTRPTSEHLSAEEDELELRPLRLRQARRRARRADDLLARVAEEAEAHAGR